MSKTILILLAVLVTSTASSARSGQEALQPGDEVRVLRKIFEPETWVSGDVIRQDGGTLTLDVSGTSMILDLDQVDVIQRREKVGNKAGTGAGVGAAVVGISGLALGAALASDDFFDVGSGAILGLTLLGAAGGALVGALIGVAIPSNGWVGVDTIQVELGVAPDGSQAISLSFRF
jgi:hypothetical protein